MKRFIFLLSLFLFAFLSCKNPKSNQQTATKPQDTAVKQQSTAKVAKPTLNFVKFKDLRSFARIVKFSPDGQYLVAGNLQLAIFQYNGSGFSPVKVFAPHSDRINAIDFTPDGKFMATASDDSTVIIYDFQGAQTRILKRLTDFSADLVTLAFSPDGKMLACATNDDSVFVYDVKNNFSLLTKFQVVGVQDVKFTHDSKYLLADAELEYDSGYENYLYAFDVENGFQQTSYVKLEPLGYEISISPDDKTIFASGTDVSYLISFSNGQLKVKQQLFINGDIPGIFVNDNQIIVGNMSKRASSDMNFIFISQLSDDYSVFQDIDFSPDKKLLSISYSDGKILIYQLNGSSLSKYAVLKDFPVFVNAIDFAGDYLFAGMGDGSSWADIRMLNLNQPLTSGQSLSDTLYNQIVSLSVTPSGNYVAAGDWRGNFYVFTKTNAGYQLSQTSKVGDNDVHVKIAPNGQFLVVACGTNLELLKNNGSQFTPVRQINETAEIKSLDFSPDGEFVAILDNQPVVRVYSVQDSFNTFKAFSLKVLSQTAQDVSKKISFSPDGKNLAVLFGYPMNRLMVYSFGGKFITVITAQGDVTDFGYSPDGKYLALSVGSFIQIYKNTVTGFEFFKQISAAPFTVKTLAFSHNGKYFAYGIDDGVVVYK